MASTYPNPASIKTPPVGTTSVQIAPQNLSRSGLYVFNASGSVIWVCPGLSTDQSPLAASATGGGSTAILPSSGLVFQEFTGAMNAIAVTGLSNQVTVWEFYHGGPTSVISAGGASSGGSGGGSGVPEAPLDGLLYGRQSAAWNQVPAGISEAPLDGNIYGRDNAAWVQLTSATNAAPFDAMAYNGMQVNGNGEISQENFTATISGGAAGTTVGKYVADSWLVGSFGAQGITWAGSAGAGPTPPPGYKGSVTVSAAVANLTPTVNDFLEITNFIEGFRFSRMAWGTASAQSISIGFWINSAFTGVYSLSLRSDSGTRSFVSGFTVNAANTWEWKTLTIPGDTTVSANWLTNYAVGLNVCINFSCGTARQATPGAWLAGTFQGVTGTTNTIPVTARFSVTGLIVVPGTQLPPSNRAPLIMRSADQEQATCMRYFEVIGTGLVGQVNGPPTSVNFGCTYKVRKRVAPTVTLLTTTPAIFAPGAYVSGAGSTVSFIGANDLNGSAVSVTGFTGLTIGQAILSNQADMLKVDARF
jgi:hypothetical protein